MDFHRLSMYTLHFILAYRVVTLNGTLCGIGLPPFLHLLMILSLLQVVARSDFMKVEFKRLSGATRLCTLPEYPTSGKKLLLPLKVGP